jgi:hypothetical protein
MRINSIKTDSDGCKLIRASLVLHFPGCKTWAAPSQYFDYKDGVLRMFTGDHFSEYPFATFKQALKFILGIQPRQDNSLFITLTPYVKI